MNRVGYDSWADNAAEGGKPATLGFLESKLKDENLGYIKERTRDGEVELKYFFGKIVLRGRVPEGVAYKLTIMPKGILKIRFEKNYKTLKEIIKSQGIKLIGIKE